MIIEYYLSGGQAMNVIFLALLILLLLFKYWILSSLGTYWNTRIYRVPGAVAVKKGPYKLFKHPNYVDVVCEIAIIPLVFHLYYTAIIFSVLNAVMLWVRIGVENKVWAD
ncbi:MAG: isoprenylcysteine carboxylmethyltransferase family protein [Bacteroidia bacterium]